MRNDELENIYHKLYRQLFLYAFSLTGNKEDAEDLVANTFVKAFISFEDGNIKAWLYQVLKNEFYNMYKKKKRIIEDYDFNRIKDNYNMLDTIIKDEEKRWLYAKIYSLKRIEKEVLLLSIQSDLDDNMIGKIMNISIENVRVIKHRAKKKLIELYKEESI